MSAPNPVGRAPQRTWTRALPSSLFLVTAAAAFHGDSLAGHPWWTSSAFTWLLLALCTGLGWWSSGLPNSKERRVFRRVEIACALVALAWLLIRLRFVSGDVG
jgi:hypothetical protein